MAQTEIIPRRDYDIDGIVEKNCPFCQGKPYLKASYNERMNMTYIFVRCSVCGGQGRAFIHAGYMEDITDAQDKVDLAIKAWDTRPKKTKRG